MVKIRTLEEFHDWLEEKPKDWAQVIAARAALRVLPIALNDRAISQNTKHTLALLRATSISWAARNYPAHDMAAAAYAAAAARAAAYADAAYAAARATAARAAAYAATAAAYAATAAADAADADADAAAATATAAYADADADADADAVWQSIEEDANYLENYNDKNASQSLSAQPLWFIQQIPEDIQRQWRDAIHRMKKSDGNFIHWIDWYEQRLVGHDAAFQIFNDIDRTEDKSILIKLADATDEDFWDKGAEYVNAQLDQWLRDARDRAQERYEQENDGIDKDVLDEENMPSQETSVTSFAPRDDGKIDRAPATPDNRLRDIPDARQSYADLRNKVKKLRQEGQRLGGNLKEALDDFLSSLPEDFEQALAYNIWRDGTNLREIFELHELAIQSPDYDPDKLENAIALRLKGVLSLFNNLAFDDDGLRQRDERIPPQKEIEHAVQETRIAQPIINAGKTNSEIYTEPVSEDICKLPERQNAPDNIFEQQELIEENKIKRNFVAALMTSARYTLKHAKESAIDVKKGAGAATGGLIVTDTAGITEASKSILKFIAENAHTLKEYVTTAYSNPSLHKLIDAVVEIVQTVIF